MGNLLDLAAEQNQVDNEQLLISAGKVKNRQTDQVYEFTKLTEGKQILQKVSDDVPTTAAQDWQITGTSVLKVDGHLFVTGKHKYTPDFKLPGMQIGKALRPPAFGAELKSLDSSASEAIPGVVVIRDNNFVGVTAPDEITARKALDALKAEWNTRPQISQKELFEHLKKTAESRGRDDTDGSVEKELAAADHKIEQTYTVQYIAHVPLEPGRRWRVGGWKTHRLDRNPASVWREIGTGTGISVRGSGTGDCTGYRFRLWRKHSGETAIEAARLAKVQETSQTGLDTGRGIYTGVFRPAGVIETRAGVRGNGKVTARNFITTTLVDLPSSHYTISQIRKPNFIRQIPICVRAPTGHWRQPPTISPGILHG